MLPFVVIECLAGAERNAKRPEIGRAAGLFGAGIHIRARFDFELDETRGCNCERDLSFQESTGNSTGPQRDVFFRALWNRLLDQDVADLQAPAWF